MPGVKYYITRLLRWLPKVRPKSQYIGLTTRSLTRGLSDKDRQDIGAPITQAFVPRFLLDAVWRYHPRVGCDALARTCDVYHVTDSRPPILATPPLITTVYDLVWDREPQCYSYPVREKLRSLLHLHLSRSRLVLSISDSTSRDLNKFYGVNSARIRTVPLACDDVQRLDEITAARNRERLSVAFSQYFLMIGQEMVKKNTPLVLRALKELRSEGREDAHLVLIGRPGNDSETINQMVQEFQLENVVLRLGYLTECDLISVFQGAKALLYPSFYEGFGLPPLQAFHLDIPVICSGRGSLPEVVGDAALIVSPYDVGQMTASMRSILNETSTTRDLISRGRTRRGLFAWKRTAQRTAEVYEELLRLSKPR